jgi:hypothetical protein
MKKLILAIILISTIVSCGKNSDQVAVEKTPAPSADVKKMMDEYNELSEACKTGNFASACEQQVLVNNEIASKGWCLGEADKKWYECITSAVKNEAKARAQAESVQAQASNPPVASPPSPPLEIACNVSDAFNEPKGAVLFNYDENDKILTLVRTEGNDLTFLNNNPSAWIIEAVGKPAKNNSTNPNRIEVKHSGKYNWEFILDRQNGTIKIYQTLMQMNWKGSCRLVDRSNKF